MAPQNPSVVLYGKGDIRIEDRPIPVPKPNQLLVKVHTVGICGSDVHYYTHGSIGRFVVREPMVLGHETSGIVVGMGSDVKGFAVGDRIALEPGIPCRQCEFCKTGRYNLCPDMVFFATPPVNGSLARYIVHDSDFCFKLPDNVTMEEGALMEPLNVAIHSCRRANLVAGQTLLVLGAGPIGLLNILTAKAMGAAKVYATDIMEARLKLAKEIGADGVFNVKNKSPADAAKEIIKSIGFQPDNVIECTGFAASIEVGITTVKNGGTIVLVGLGADRVEMPIVEATCKEIDLRGIFRYVNCYPTAIEMVASGRLKLDKLTRAHFKFEDSVKAFEKSSTGDVVKVFIHYDESS
ncbi:unnamed protein product [Dracunculus medinensis]|uniref:Sorbitol dehydrogenase n=1 Tax=Dracunculus medinensis TaxID=318479 RepID=A0A0N4U0C7_DRAME|nr:unnamed protein product [Dracunculus medinensis]